MPTEKYRVNVSVTPEIRRALEKLAKRDHTTVSSKALVLMSQALEIEEDLGLLSIVKQREAKKGSFVSHEDAWV